MPPRRKRRRPFGNQRPWYRARAGAPAKKLKICQHCLRKDLEKFQLAIMIERSIIQPHLDKMNWIQAMIELIESKLTEM